MRCRQERETWGKKERLGKRQRQGGRRGMRDEKDEFRHKEFSELCKSQEPDVKMFLWCSRVEWQAVVNWA